MRARLWMSCVIAALVSPAGALGHASVQSVGRDASGVRVTFSAPIDDAFLRVDVDGRSIAASVDSGDDHALVVSDAPGDAPDLRLRVVSSDGHVTVARVDVRGPSPRVRATSSPRSVVSILADVLVFAAMLGLIGLVAVRAAVVGPAWRAGGTRPPGAAHADVWRHSVEPHLRHALDRWWPIWWGVVAVASAGVILQPIGLLLELDSGDVGALLSTRWGTAWLVQVAGVAVAAWVAWRWSRSAERTDPDVRAGWAYGVAGPLAAAAVAVAWAGHASSGTDAAVGIGLDALHLVATGVWLGGLVALAGIVPRVRRRLADTESTRFTAAVVVRFSALAIMCVGTLVVTGVYRAIAELSGFGDLVDTGYGRALLVKLIVFALLLVGGVYNRLVLHPRLERAALGLYDGDRGAAQALRVSVAAELAVAVCLLIVVGVLVNLPPP